MFRMNTSLLFPKLSSLGSIIIQNTRHEITRWWRPPASTGKVLTYLWPNRPAHARSVLPRWPPWLYWSSPGFDSRCLQKVPRLSPFCRCLTICTRYFKIISLLSGINELYKIIILDFWFSNTLFKRLKVRLLLLVSWVFWTNFDSKKVTWLWFFVY